MFCLFLGINAWTDFKEGCIYDVLSVILFICAIFESGLNWNKTYFLGSCLFLGVLWILDKREKFLGRGDYLVLLSVSLYADWQLPMILIVTSGLALIFMAIRQKRTIPFVPFLFLGTIFTKIII